jgi:hypothetical protein
VRSEEQLDSLVSDGVQSRTYIPHSWDSTFSSCTTSVKGHGYVARAFTREHSFEPIADGNLPHKTGSLLNRTYLVVFQLHR